MTPQQINGGKYFGIDVDLWGVAQVIYYCLQGTYACNNYTED